MLDNQSMAPKPPADALAVAADGSRPRSVLVIEDSPIVAHALEVLLVELGFKVIGPAPTIETALHFAHTASPNLALVDLNLAGKMADKAVDRLMERGVPVILTTGFSGQLIPRRFGHLACCTKPYDARQLLQHLTAAVS